MDTTPRKRVKILTLHEHTAKKQREIASIVDVNQSTVSRILKQARTTGTLAPKRKEKCGRKRKTSTRDDIRLLRESKKDPRKTSDMLRKDLLTSGVNVRGLMEFKPPLINCLFSLSGSIDVTNALLFHFSNYPNEMVSFERRKLHMISNAISSFLRTTSTGGFIYK